MSGRATRVVVVLGYSDGGRDELHPVCAARLARAAEISDRRRRRRALRLGARAGDALGGGADGAPPGAGGAREVVVDPDARTTVGNAANALDDVRRVGAREVVVVTSRWHAPRASGVPLLLRGSGVRVTAAFPPEPRTSRASLRELPLWPLLPAQLASRRCR